MMDDLISRQAAIRLAEQGQVQGFEWQFKQLVDLPSVSTEKTGRWKKISPANIYECSECGQNVMTDDICAYKFCHGRGAKMEVEE